MKTLLAMLLISAILLFGCTGGTSGQPAAPSQQAGAQQPAAGSPAPLGADAMQPSGAASPSETGTQPPAATATPPVKEFRIEASDWQFSPDTITVNRGDRVKITLVNVDVSHGIAIPGYGFDLKAEAGQTASAEFIADKNGTFPFRCNVFCGEGHREMTGTLVVQ